MFLPADYLDLNRTQHSILFPAAEPVWAALSKIESYLEFRLQRELRCAIPPGAFIGEDVFIDEGTTIEPGAVIKGPAWIGKNCVIRAGCYIRENVIVGNACVLGNSCEFKNCVVFDHCEVPHYNYVGDSILGYKAHLGAGVVLSNVRLDRSEVVVTDGKTSHRTGLKKFGAVIGDHAEIGCNSVINPGTIIGRRSIVYPLTSFSGVLPGDSILKTRQQQQVVKRMV
ncbi:transferase hexapeptide (six repeat-containing protein) [Prosthecobacter debontii]|uniref:Transferase hexapeptide (Six repeat-containing protein) n=1 Tax=Prosthecobacter debontii TaxID=48467 RepID=A0A1T4YSQ6_9BACT|nr:UDP-N-acetylglucosamine diphosphorylase [Prosthecobacter debontii]SKB04819.1 transferase hexapeptide (six repeat-containing protein) [Prosthecobacter debontii]